MRYYNLQITVTRCPFLSSRLLCRCFVAAFSSSSGKRSYSTVFPYCPRASSALVSQHSLAQLLLQPLTLNSDSQLHEFQVEDFFDRRSIGQCVLVSGTGLAHDQIWITVRFLLVVRPAWREDESTIYSCNFYWTLPDPSLSGPNLAEYLTISYCLISDWSPFLLQRLARLRWRYSAQPLKQSQTYRKSDGQ